MFQLSCYLPLWVLACARSFCKYVVHWWTSKSEIERILADHGRHSVDMTCDFFSSLVQSKVLVETKNDILVRRRIDVERSISEITKNKRFDKKSRLLLANTRICLNCVLYVQEVEAYIQEMKSVSFNWSNRQHYDILDKFWTNMRPGERRSSEQVCADWGDVGFQGHDPSTDFRGMGLLGLHQLTYISCKEGGREARRALTESMHPRRYYPFAATGINITAFVLELLVEFRLNRLLLSVLEEKRLTMVSEDGTATTSGFGTPLISVGVSVVHDVYCDVFVAFNNLWVERDPPNVMHFKTVFKEVQDRFRQKYKALGELRP